MLCTSMLWYVATLCYTMLMATKTKTVRARVEPKLKKDAEAVLRKVGLTSSEAIALFYRRVALVRGLPFEMRVPNKETLRAIQDMHNSAKRAKMKSASTTDKMFEEILGKNWRKSLA